MGGGGWGERATLVRQKKALTLAVPSCSPMETSQRDLWAYYFRNRRLDKKRTVDFEDLRVLRLPQCRGGEETDLYLVLYRALWDSALFGCYKTVALWDSGLFGCYKTVLCFGATRRRLVWMLKYSASVRCCRTAHCVGASRQCLNSERCAQHFSLARRL